MEFSWMGADVQGVLFTAILLLVSAFVVFGGVIPYIFQWREIRQTQNARGFSLFVCLNLLLANILRILFWIGRRFEVQLLLQSVVMIVAMLVLVRTAVAINRHQVLPPHKHRSIWNGDFLTYFWSWSDFSSYVLVTGLFALLLSVLTHALQSSRLFVEALGFAALFMEANLGTPQLLNNWRKKSTVGMSMRMVLLWFLGDMSKTIYFLARKTPAQFWLCGGFQIGIDIIILAQVAWYPNYKLNPVSHA